LLVSGFWVSIQGKIKNGILRISLDSPFLIQKSSNNLHQERTPHSSPTRDSPPSLKQTNGKNG
jgi:hypothetical protein